MPIYEFRCAECGARFEVRRPFDLSNEPAPSCPEGHTAARKVLSVFATAGRSSDATASAPSFSGGCGAGCACAAAAAQQT